MLSQEGPKGLAQHQRPPKALASVPSAVGYDTPKSVGQAVLRSTVLMGRPPQGTASEPILPQTPLAM